VRVVDVGANEGADGLNQFMVYEVVNGESGEGFGVNALGRESVASVKSYFCAVVVAHIFFIL
jgi:hypothetical protein